MNTTAQAFEFDRETMKMIREIAQTLDIDDIEVIRNGLKLMSIYADFKREKEGGRILIQIRKDEPAQELNIT